MDLYKTIRDLQDELKRINYLITVLEDLQNGETAALPASRRGRKAMGESERAEVSRRMKAYWAAKNKKPKP
jgi:hypothetical protein